MKKKVPDKVSEEKKSWVEKVAPVVGLVSTLGGLVVSLFGQMPVSVSVIVVIYLVLLMVFSRQMRSKTRNWQGEEGVRLARLIERVYLGCLVVIILMPVICVGCSYFTQKGPTWLASTVGQFVPEAIEREAKAGGMNQAMMKEATRTSKDVLVAVVTDGDKQIGLIRLSRVLEQAFNSWGFAQTVHTIAAFVLFLLFVWLLLDQLIERLFLALFEVKLRGPK